MKTRRVWDFKASGTYEAPWGIRLSPVLRHQSGANFARSSRSARRRHRGRRDLRPAPRLRRAARTRNREDNIRVFDIRAEKSVQPDRPRARARLFFDLFNITNSHASETRTVTTGTAYLRPTAMLAPLTARIGARLSF